MIVHPIHCSPVHCHLSLFLHGMNATFSAWALSNDEGSFRWAIAASLLVRKMQNPERNSSFLIIFLNFWHTALASPWKVDPKASLSRTLLLIPLYRGLNCNNSYCHRRIRLVTRPTYVDRQSTEVSTVTSVDNSYTTQAPNPLVYTVWFTIKYKIVVQIPFMTLGPLIHVSPSSFGFLYDSSTTQDPNPLVYTVWFTIKYKIVVRIPFMTVAPLIHISPSSFGPG